MFNKLAVLLTLSVSLISAQDYDPYRPGPHEMVRSFINISAFDDLPTHLDVWAPIEAGNYPIVYFLDGYGGAMPGEAYELIFEKLASHGVVIALPWKPRQDLSVDEKIPFFQSIIDWCEENLNQFLIEEWEMDSGMMIDFDTAIALGHSAGAHVICSYLRKTCGPFKGLALLSPVDGADPWGIQDDFCTYPNETVNFDIPSLIMPSGLDAVAGLANIACAPEKLSNRRYYQALPSESPKWMINATDYGHVDFMDPLFQSVAGVAHFCAVNETATELQFASYRSYVAGQLSSFINGLLSDNCGEYFIYLQDPEVMTASVDVEFEVDQLECPKPYCNWTPMP